MAKDEEEKKEKVVNVWEARYVNPDTNEEESMVGIGSNVNIAISKARKKVKANSKKAKNDDQFVVEILGMTHLHKAVF